MKEPTAERGVLDILNDLKSGRVAGSSLDVETRRRCVEYLAVEGAANAEMAQLLDVTDRTIRRDREAVREANALAVDDTFASQIAGELLMEGRQAVARVRRVTREKQTHAATRIEGERVVVEILDRVTQRLQSLGFLPMAAKHIKADLTHTVDPFGTPEAIQTEIERLASLAGGPDSPSIDHLRGAAKLLTSVEPAEGSQP